VVPMALSGEYDGFMLVTTAMRPVAAIFFSNVSFDLR